MGKIPWRRQWHPTLVFLPEKSHRHRLVGYSLWSHEESDTTEPLSSHTCKTLIYMWLLIKTCLFTFKSSLYLSSTKSYYPPCGTIAEAVTHWRWMALLCAGFSGLWHLEQDIITGGLIIKCGNRKKKWTNNLVLAIFPLFFGSILSTSEPLPSGLGTSPRWMKWMGSLAFWAWVGFSHWNLGEREVQRRKPRKLKAGLLLSILLKRHLNLFISLQIFAPTVTQSSCYHCPLVKLLLQVRLLLPQNLPSGDQNTYWLSITA